MAGAERSVRGLLQRVASIAADYRAGELPAPDPDHIRRWIEQFDEVVREPVLREIAHVLEKTYMSRAQCEAFVRSLAKKNALAGNDPATFWNSVHFLRVQQGGESQIAMLDLFSKVLKKEHGIATLPEGPSETFVYLDDVSFSGNRILRDLRDWIAGRAPARGRVHIIVIALHAGGQYYSDTELKKATRAAGKALEFQWWRSTEVEDRRDHTNTSDVLRPTQVPHHELVQAYVAQMRYQPVLRQAGNVGGLGLFSSDAGRQVLEQEFLKMGCRIRQICPNLPIRHRPLGYSVLETLGFGTMMVTYRNCPNNAPLALWAGDPWYPLFPRKNN